MTNHFRLTFGIAVTIIALVTFPVFAQQFDATLDEPSEVRPATGPAADDEPEVEKPDFGNYKLTRGAKEFGIDVGIAPTQPTFLSGRKEYDTNGRKFGMLSFRFGRVIGTVKGVTYQYIFEAIPVSFAIKNEVRNPEFVSEEKTPKIAPTVRANTFGFAIQPVGFRFIFKPERRLKPYIQVGAGFIFTQKPVPVPESPNYNFASDFGGGLMYHISRKRTISFGYRYFHISNMNIGEINPGYNANIFSAGYSFFSK